MKKILLIALIITVSNVSKAQVFNTGQTLSPGTFSVGIQPAVLINGNSNFMLFLHGGYGVTRGIDFALKLGVLGNKNYFGADVEFALDRNMSVSFGAHDFGVFGLDGTFLIDIPLRNDVRLFTGADLDINFANETQILFWLPIGIEIGLKSNMNFIFESSIGLTDPAYNIIGGGLNFYF
ncbi:MAG: hypothetical protein ACFCUM_09750 [Bacteroidales bacterium]